MWDKTSFQDFWGWLEAGGPASMQIETEEVFRFPCGFIPLRERHVVKAVRGPVNSQDRHCRIGKVKLK